jgi:hypothetical protein
MYCAECDRIEDDPTMLDVERCSICGGLLCQADFDDDGQPTEQQKWQDYDRDC